MKKLLFLMLSLSAIVTYQVSAVEVRGGAAIGNGSVSVGGGARYGNHGGKYAEGTISGRGADGRLTVRGINSPYANDYYSYQHDYYSTPDQRTVLSERYRDRFNYTYNDADATDYTFTVPDTTTTTIYEEPNYGSDYSSWKYDNEPRAYHYNDLNVGDRVVVGYDENGYKVNSMYRVNPRTKENASRTDNTRPGAPANTNVHDNTRPNNTGAANNTAPNAGGASHTGGNNTGGGNTAPANAGGRSNTGGNNTR